MNSPQLVNTAAQAHHSSADNSSGSSSASASTPAAAANKFAPARRLAARQTLRLAIPKQQGDSSTTMPPPPTQAQTSHIYRHSPSQLPPAPLLKRHTSGNSCGTGSGNSFIPKSASPLESHKLPNVTPGGGNSTPLIYNGAAASGSGCSSAASSASNAFLSVRKPSLTLNSSDIRNNNDLFAFAKDMSPALELSGE